jgi:hypothetical protein
VGKRLCLLLDGERNRRVSQDRLRRRFDNRYDYLAHMLPPAARLHRWGIQRAQWLSRAAAPPPDLEPYVTSLLAYGLPIASSRLAP